MNRIRFRAHHKLFLSYALLVAAVVLILTIGVDASLRRPLIERAASDLSRELALGREIYDAVPTGSPDSLARHIARLTGHRVTVIGLDGTVLGDSGLEPATVPLIDNHGDRPEFHAALRAASGWAIRRSTSVGTDLLYVATVTGRGEVIRFAVGVEQIDAAVARVRRQVMQVGGLALLLAALFAYGFSFVVTGRLRQMRRIAGKMADGELTARVRARGSDELAELGTALDALADELQRRLGQLEAERAEMTALIDSMAEAVLAVAPDGKLRRANPAARRIFRLGSSVEGILPEAIARRQPFLEIVNRALAGQAVPATELTHAGQHLLATAEPLPGGGAVLVFLDTSELQRLEGVRRDFVANASHELKTPLTAIRGYSEALLEDDVPADLRGKFVETIQQNATRLQKILDDLLDLSRIESGAWPLDPQPVDTVTAARDAWQGFALAAQERGIEFHCETRDPASAVQADPDALRQIFTNLYSNSVRYTPSGGAISVAARSAGPEVEIEVRDTGTGIAAEHLSRIFERFYRVDPARSRADGGTGLGLAIVRHLVEQQGGRISAESTLGQGTTIRFFLPAATTAATASGA